MSDRLQRSVDGTSQRVTELLTAWTNGDESALTDLLPLVFDELRRIARHHMRSQRPGHLLQTTALVNEAYLRLCDLNRIRWQDRAHFLAMASRLMRRVLVDCARADGALKRGRGHIIVTLNEATPATEPAMDIVALDDALTALAKVDPRKCQVVELRFFGGLSVEETAAHLDLSAATVVRDWRLARAWLLRQLQTGLSTCT